MKKKNKYLRIISLVLSLVTLATTGTVGGFTWKNRRVVATCGDYKIRYEEIRYEAMTYRHRNPDASEEEIRLAVEQAIKERYAVLDLCTEVIPELIENVKAIKEAVKENEKEIIDSLDGGSEYRKSLKEIYANRHFFKQFLKLTIMQGELENEVYKGTNLESDKSLLEWWKDGNCVRVTRVTFSERDAAEALLAELNAGKTLEELVGSDTLAGSTIDPHYYYFRDLHGSAEEAAALALADTGALSGVVETSDGYLVMIREADDFDTLLYQTSAALNLYRESAIAELIAKQANTMTFKWNRRGRKLSFCDMK